jgi:hypothetical protein
MPTIDPTTPAGVQPTIPGAAGYTLVMSDEFNSSSLDSKWQIFRSFGNFNPAFNWDINNGGNSMFRCWPDADAGYPDFTMRSTGSNPFLRVYGVWEVRVKMCRGRGIFPSVWVYKHPDANPQCEIDIFECYGYDGGGWNDGAANGWRPTNSAWTIWRDGGGPPTVQSGTLKLSDAGLGGGDDLSSQHDTYTLVWEPDGLTFYYNNQIWGSKTGAIWSASEINGPYGPCAAVVDLWFRKAGLPEPDSSRTPSGPSNSMEIDYIRVWELTGIPVPSASSTAGDSFAATLSFAPPSSATITGTVTFGVFGTAIRNAELLPSAGATPIYGTFTINSAMTVANLSWDTTALTSGPIDVRIVAYAVPPGSSGSSTTVMAPRRYYISNPSSSEMPVLTFMDINF